jgi:putative alpha-1,2-mannosidase
VVTATEALLKDSFTEPQGREKGLAGKEGLRDYQTFGFLPASHGAHDVVSRTLDYGFSDFATAQALRHLDRLAKAAPSAHTAGLADRFKAHQFTNVEEKATKLWDRSVRAHKSLFSSRVGLMVPKQHDGEDYQPYSWNNIKWGDGYTEGNAWHHSFPPYHLEKLAELHGGRPRLLAKLRQMLRARSNFGTGSYGGEIHEMTEARAVAMGQYAHNNQPVHHILWLFAMLGQPDETNRLVRRVQVRVKSTTDS